MWTTEELEEMRRADAEIEADFVLSHDEIVAARERDRAALGRHGLAAYQRAYREANKEQVAAKKRAYYEAHKEQVAAYQRAYYEARRQRKESDYADRILMDRR